MRNFDRFNCHWEIRGSGAVGSSMGRVGRIAALLATIVAGGCAVAHVPQKAARPSNRPAAATKVKSGPQKEAPAATITDNQPVLPAWAVVKPSKPSPQRPSPLGPAELFARASPSVYVVQARKEINLKVAVAQGSAVAVSSSEAITNCHIVTHAKQISLSRGGVEFQAEVISADRFSDRCYLKVREGTLQHVLGIRGYSDLAVGETVYTIGSPKGLDM